MKKTVLLVSSLLLLSGEAFAQSNLLNDADFTLTTDPAGWFGWDGAGIDPVTNILSVSGTTGTFTPLSSVQTVLNDGFAPWTANALVAGDYVWSADITGFSSDGTVEMYASWQDASWGPAGAGEEVMAITGTGVHTLEFTLDSDTAFFNQVGFRIDGWTAGSISIDSPSLTLIPEPSLSVLFFGLLALGGAMMRRRK